MTIPKSGRGRWQLYRERFQLDEYARPAPPESLALLSDSLPAVMKSLGLEERFWEQQLVEEWPALVGAAVAKHARPGRVQRQVLYVFVKNSAWLNELVRYGQKQMLANIQKRFGDRIKSVRIQLDPDA